MSILIRRALPEETAQLSEAAAAAGLDERYVAEQSVYGAWEGTRLSGFFALEPRDDGWWLAHLWIAPWAAGRGRGSWLLADAVRRARRMGAESLRLHPEAGAEPFFRRLGARPAPDGEPGDLVIEVASWLEPLADSVSELGTLE